VNTILVRPATSWMSMLGGWIATIGAMALVAPAVAGMLAGVSVATNEIAPALPVVIGIFISYLIGGYVAGRMAGYRTSWHGMLTAFFSLFVFLVIVLVTYAAANGAFAGIGVNNLTDYVPGAAGLNIDSLGNALTFGALLGFLAAILGGWLGGVLAPSHAEVHATVPYVAREAGPVPGRSVGVGPVGARPMKRQTVRDTRRRPFFPAFGRKGGERVEERHEVREVEERRDPDVERT
jgi:MFS family permease